MCHQTNSVSDTLVSMNHMSDKIRLEQELTFEGLQRNSPDTTKLCLGICPCVPWDLPL